MPTATTYSSALFGVQAVPVEIEVDLIRRLPKTTIIGVPASAARETAERVRSAIVSAGFDYPKYRITVHVSSPCRNDGTQFDLPIAVAILVASGQLPVEAAEVLHYVGELALDGRVRPVRGVLPHAECASQAGLSPVVPAACLPEALLAGPARPLDHLADIADIDGMLASPAVSGPLDEGRVHRTQPDFADVVDQPVARRALEIAAAGGHNVLLIGPPGVGKTQLAARLPSILPPLVGREALDVTRVHSVAGLFGEARGLVRQRPFRAPHHSVSSAGMFGSSTMRPGEASLAHNGVLFLDELPEFSRHVLEMLRAPLKDRKLVLNRVAGTVELPANFILVGATNPCPCGFLGHPLKPCRCTDEIVDRYQARLSGPLVDKFDLFVQVEPLLGVGALYATESGEASEPIRERVVKARGRQPGMLNRDLGDAFLSAVGASGPAHLMASGAADRLGLSRRGIERLWRVARTIADLDGQETIALEHVAESLAFRALNVGGPA